MPPLWELDVIWDCLRSAGAIAQRYYAAPPARLKNDGTLVTAADREIEHVLTDRLEDVTAGCFVIGEETVADRSADYLQRALKETVYIIDPIDGTAPYAHHIPTWGISVGLAVGGVLREGAVYLPITRELFVSDGEAVLFALVDESGERGPWRRLEPVPDAWEAGGIVAITQGMAKGGELTFRNSVHTLCCAVFPMTYMLLGRYLAYMGSLKLWDLAGAWPLLHKLGVEAELLDGTPVDCRISEGVYCLDVNDPNCWKLRDVCLFATPGVKPRIRAGVQKACL